MKIMRVGIDLAKDVFQVHGVGRDERVVWQRKLRRADWMRQLLKKIEPGCEIGMEACHSNDCSIDPGKHNIRPGAASRTAAKD